MWNDINSRNGVREDLHPLCAADVSNGRYAVSERDSSTLCDYTGAVEPIHGFVRMNSDWSFMRMILLILVLAIVPAVAQIPLIHLLNASRPGSDFRVGDRFEIVITAAPDQPVSVRTMRQGRTDWSPVIGSTDSTGGQ
jgi:hypothetical protein